MVTTAPTGARTGQAPAAGPEGGSRRFVAVVFGVVAVALFAVSQLSVAFLPSAPVPGHGFPDHPGFDGWTRWDTDWYNRIARLGYYYNGPGEQSAVAFFPGYPAAMRLVAFVVRDTLVAGVVVTYAAGFAAAALLWRWCRAALGARAARLAVAVLVLYPFAFFLFGVVYSDALFLAAALAAFVLLEEDHPWLAGLAGAVATASRPVGVAVTVGLAVRAVERRGGFRRLRWRDAGVLLSVAGLAAFMALLWYRFGDPLAMTKVYAADGWYRSVDLETALKLRWFRLLRDGGLLDAANLALTLQGFLTVVALALVPVAGRRFGWGYGVYALGVILIPLSGTSDFLSMGRYVLAAFPCFGAGAAVLASRRWLAAGWLGASAAGLAVMASTFARWYFYG